MTTIALLSPGAMGSALAARFTAHGARVLTSLAGRSRATASRAAAAGMIDAADADLARADLILSVVPPAEAEPLVRRLLPAMGEARALFLDANALAPASKRVLAGLVEDTGAAFLDGCIIGGPPAPGRPGPVLYVAGAAGAAVAMLGGLGIDVRRLDGPVGAAAALKMCYGGINKGLVGLATAMLRAAERAGAGVALREEMARSMPDLARRFASQVPDMYPKAYRWVAEMHEIAGFLADDPAGAAVYDGMAQLFGLMADDVAGAGAERAALDRALARRAG